jgi:hypothetical protein
LITQDEHAASSVRIASADLAVSGRQNGFSASWMTSLQPGPTSCTSRSVQRVSSRRCICRARQT